MKKQHSGLVAIGRRSLNAHAAVQVAKRKMGRFVIRRSDISGLGVFTLGATLHHPDDLPLCILNPAATSSAMPHGDTRTHTEPHLHLLCYCQDRAAKSVHGISILLQLNPNRDDTAVISLPSP